MIGKVMPGNVSLVQVRSG